MGGAAKDRDGLTVPLGLALWAKVSAEVDVEREAQAKDGAPLRLAPADWTSGDIPWLPVTVAPPELKERLVEKANAAIDGGKAEIKVFG